MPVRESVTGVLIFSESVANVSEISPVKVGHALERVHFGGTPDPTSLRDVGHPLIN